MPQGFKTAKGSTYRLTAEGQTIRTKRSAGKGRGTTYPPFNCLYIGREEWDFMLRAEKQKAAFVLGYAGPDAKGFKHVEREVLAIPEGMVATIHVYNPEERKSLRLIQAQVHPKVGLYPVEARFDGSPIFHTHIGNRIVEIYE